MQLLALHASNIGRSQRCVCGGPAVPMQSAHASQVAVPAFRDAAEQRVSTSLVEYFQVKQGAAPSVSKAVPCGIDPQRQASRPAERPAARLPPHCMQHLPCFVSSGGQVAALGDWKDAQGPGWQCTVIEHGRNCATRMAVSAYRMSV